MTRPQRFASIRDHARLIAGCLRRYPAISLVLSKQLGRGRNQNLPGRLPDVIFLSGNLPAQSRPANIDPGRIDKLLALERDRLGSLRVEGCYQEDDMDDPFLHFPEKSK
jgi:hypothetical protein